MLKCFVTNRESPLLDDGILGMETGMEATLPHDNRTLSMESVTSDNYEDPWPLPKREGLVTSLYYVLYHITSSIINVIG